MAARSVRAPSGSTDPSPSTYHVFLSFRGADTRTSFTDFLYEALVRAGFHTFRDDNEIRRGKRIEAEIRRGIEESKLFIIVLSKGYAFSEWCLDELVMIMERGGVVVPVFYDVDPDQVSDQTNCYAEAFARHREKFEDDRVEGWRQALRDVANLAGLVLGERPQSKFVEEIVETVRKEFVRDRVAEQQQMKRKTYGASIWRKLLPWHKCLAHLKDREELPCDATIGTEAKFNEIWSCLKNKDVGIFGLYGIGGVGKTTLLTQIRNKLVISYNNLLVIWVVVGKSSNFEKIQADIGEEIGVLHGSPCEKRVRIYNKLLKNKFILLLDDIWERVRLNEIGIPTREKMNGSKIIFTTRSLKVCGEMLAQKKIKIETLEWEYAWKLFKKHVGDIVDDPEVLLHAKSMAKKCGGLPIALITIGRAMSYKTELWEWRRAIEILKKPVSYLQNSGDEVLNELEVEVFSLLKFSFDNLPNEKVKSCFLFCALFPDDFLINKDFLVNYWICENICIDIAHHEGQSTIALLTRLCLLEEEGNFVKLHDVIRDMALWIQRNDTLVMANMRLREAPTSELWEGVKKLSLIENKIEKLTPMLACSNLVTLLLRRNRELNEIHEDFFQFMSTLTILDLSFTSLKKLPRSIIYLVSLQHLNISRTSIKELPVGLTRLDKLKYLGLGDLRLAIKRSEKIISCLSSLEVVYMWNCAYNYLDKEKEDEEEKREEEDGEFLLQEFQSLKHLKSLGMTIRCLSTLKRFLSNKMMSITNSLCLLDYKGSKSLHIYFLVNMKNLNQFGIINCDFERIEVDCTEIGGSQSFGSLQLRDISFNGLQKVVLFGCFHLQDLTWLIFVPNLTNLTVVECENLEEIISEVSYTMYPNRKPFSRLDFLYLRSLPQLNCIYPNPLPLVCLTTISVSKCPLLKKLPLDSNSKEGSKIRLDAEEEWWEAIEWENDAIKAALLPRFRFAFF